MHEGRFFILICVLQACQEDFIYIELIVNETWARMRAPPPQKKSDFLQTEHSCLRLGPSA